MRKFTWATIFLVTIAVGVLAQEFHEIRLYTLAPLRPLNQCAAIQRIRGQAEVHELLEQLQGLITQRAALVEDAQRIHDHRRIPIPVKEIIRLGIIGGEHR